MKVLISGSKRYQTGLNQYSETWEKKKNNKNIQPEIKHCIACYSFLKISCVHFLVRNLSK